MLKTCKIDGCETDKNLRKGMCLKHYTRNRRHGSPHKFAEKKEAKTISFIGTAVLCETDECINWPYAKNSNGYGVLRVKGKHSLAHRVALTVSKGDKPNMEAAHSCGNRACVNPRHLKWATHYENMQDCHAHKTYNLSPEQVVKIRRANKSLSTADLARQLNLDYSSVWNARSRQHYNHSIYE